MGSRTALASVAATAELPGLGLVVLGDRALALAVARLGDPAQVGVLLDVTDLRRRLCLGYFHDLSPDFVVIQLMRIPDAR